MNVGDDLGGDGFVQSSLKLRTDVVTPYGKATRARAKEGSILKDVEQTGESSQDSEGDQIPSSLVPANREWRSNH